VSVENPVYQWRSQASSRCHLLYNQTLLNPMPMLVVQTDTFLLNPYACGRREWL